MTNEEIKALGLREGDVVDPTFRCKVDHVADDGTVILHGVHYNPKLLIAIERVMPGLPDGWEWVEPRNSTTMAMAKRDEAHVAIDADGSLFAWMAISEWNEMDDSIPALVAKALLEVWGRTQ